MTALSFKGIHKTYAPDFHAIKGVTLNINQGDFFCLLGLRLGWGIFVYIYIYIYICFVLV